MQTFNQIIVQLREANRYALAKNPLLRRLAVILLDNIIELQLQNRARFAFLQDRTTWYHGVRKHDKHTRKGVAGNYGRLLAFAQSEDWISAEDAALLQYVHRVRNAFYHEGDHESLDAELSIRLCYRFAAKLFSIWTTSQFGVMVSPYDAIPLDATDEDGTGQCPLLIGSETDEGEDLWTQSSKIRSQAYWGSCLETILTYRPTDDIRILIHRKVTAFLDQIENNIDNITEDPELDFNWILSRRFAVFSPAFVRNIRENKPIHALGALNIYLAVQAHEEKLLDIADEVQRATQFHQLLHNHPFDSAPVTRTQIATSRKTAETILSDKEEQGIATFLKIEDEFNAIADVLREMVWDLDGYIEERIDEIRGK